MTTITKPKRESEVLAFAKKGAKTSKILREMLTKAQCCVNHLCGCK